MKYLAASMLVLSGLTCARAVTAEELSPDARAAALKVAVTVCATCHGPQGVSLSPKFPRLAGQSAAYITAQMKNFKSHTRGDADAIGYMWGMAAPLDDDVIAGLAEYYSKQKPPAGERASDAGAVARGKAIYAEGIAAGGIPPCGSCHGANAAGTADFPRLAGQTEQYLVKQLRAFHSNMRDVAVMHGVTSGLSPANMTDVAAYLASLGP
jgi:cytochrome c553